VITKTSSQSNMLMRELAEGQSEFTEQIVSCGTKLAPRKKTDGRLFLIRAICSEINPLLQKYRILAHLWYISQASKWSISGCSQRMADIVELNLTTRLSRLWEAAKEACSSEQLRKMTSPSVSQKSPLHKRGLDSRHGCNLGQSRLMELYLK
jgi:hypothetical protein